MPQLKGSLKTGSLIHWESHSVGMVVLAGTGIHREMLMLRNPMDTEIVAMFPLTERSEIRRDTTILSYNFIWFLSCKQETLLRKFDQLTSLDRRSMLKSILGFTVANFIERNCSKGI